MPKRTNPGAHSVDKQELRQLLLFVDDMTSSIPEEQVVFTINLPENLPAADMTDGKIFRMKVEAKDLEGQPIKFFNGPGAVVTLTATTVGDGDVASPASPDFTEGVGYMDVALSGTWAAGDSINVSPLFFLKGGVVSNATSSVPQTFPATISVV